MGAIQLGPGDKMVGKRKKLTTSWAVLGDGEGMEMGMGREVERGG